MGLRRYIRECVICGCNIATLDTCMTVCSSNCKATLDYRGTERQAELERQKKIEIEKKILRKKKRRERLEKKANRRKKGSKIARLKLKLLNAKEEISKLKNNQQVYNFYDSKKWKLLRYEALRKYGRKCMLCQTTNGAMHVDHIKPRSIWPSLELDINNLQILCADCNLGKSNIYDDDWRKQNVNK